MAVVDLLSAWLSDGVVDPQAIPWFLTCRGTLTPPVRARLLRTAARMALVVDGAAELLNEVLREGMAPVAAVREIDGVWGFEWTDSGFAVRNDDVETVVDAIACVVALVEITRGLELGTRMALKKAILKKVAQIDAYGEGDGVPRLLTRLMYVATHHFLRGLAQYYDPALRPALA